LRILSIESSLRQGSVAALLNSSQDAEVIKELPLTTGERSAQTLLPTISELLAAVHWRPHDIDLICVTTGPGSFTGLRIGVTAAKTLAFALKAPLVGVHTLAAIAGAVPDRKNRLWAILDAQRQELFVAVFEDTVTPMTPETRILAIDDWLAQLKPGDSVVGPPLAQLAGHLPAGVHCVDAKYWQPQAGVVGKLGYQLFETGQIVEPMQLVPDYYRKSAAEEKVAAKK
jgi:tRNA threonylcarbamoyladenosine biosynthesis protein TsaB